MGLGQYKAIPYRVATPMAPMGIPLHQWPGTRIHHGSICASQLVRDAASLSGLCFTPFWAQYVPQIRLGHSQASSLLELHIGHRPVKFQLSSVQPRHHI